MWIIYFVTDIASAPNIKPEDIKFNIYKLNHQIRYTDIFLKLKNQIYVNILKIKSNYSDYDSKISTISLRVKAFHSIKI